MRAVFRCASWAGTVSPLSTQDRQQQPTASVSGSVRACLCEFLERKRCNQQERRRGPNFYFLTRGPFSVSRTPFSWAVEHIIFHETFHNIACYVF